MPLPLTVSCFSKFQIGFTFLVPAHLVVPDKGPLNWCCNWVYSSLPLVHWHCWLGIMKSIWLACRKLFDEVLALLSVWSEVQTICMWSNYATSTPSSLASLKLQIASTFLLPAYPSYPGKKVVKWLFVCLTESNHLAFIIAKGRNKNRCEFKCQSTSVCLHSQKVCISQNDKIHKPHFDYTWFQRHYHQ